MDGCYMETDSSSIEGLYATDRAAGRWIVKAASVVMCPPSLKVLNQRRQTTR